MEIYFAPMEGITGFVYRRAHHEFFPHVDGYYTPFLSPTQNHRFSPRELNEVLPEHNRGIHVVPQLLTHSAVEFLWAAKELNQMGYAEVNLNLGCPSGTVTAKRKGAGFLAYPEELDRFFEEVFEKIPMEVSIKTRLGVQDPREFYDLAAVFNRYPFKKIILHPRVRTDFYKNKPNREMFKQALSLLHHEVWYNGDLFTARDFKTFTEEFPKVTRVMAGRGLVENPNLAGEVKGGEPLTVQRLTQFHDAVFQGYLETIDGEKNVYFKMKELWTYLFRLFEEPERQAKKIRKAKTREEYEAAVHELLTGCTLKMEDVNLPR